MAENYQTYTATIEITYSSEVFKGDPDDVYQLADLEKGWIEDHFLHALESFDSDEKLASFIVTSVVPEIAG